VQACKSKRARTWQSGGGIRRAKRRHSPSPAGVSICASAGRPPASARPSWWRRGDGSFRKNPLQLHNFRSSVSEPPGGDLGSSDGRASRKASRKRPRHTRHKKWREVSCALRKAAGSLTGESLEVTAAGPMLSAVLRNCAKTASTSF
jgi:hypothetical protein